MKLPAGILAPAHRANTVLGVLLVICFCSLLIAKIWLPAFPLLRTSFYVVTFSVLLAISLWRPLWGILIIVAFLPVERLLPDISFMTSLYPLLGAATLLGYIVRDVWYRHTRPVLQPAHIAMLLFFLWIAASNPHAAFTMSTRVWFFTFLQLGVFMILVSQLVRSAEDFRLIAAGFLFTAVVSAAFAIPQVQLGADSASSVRAVGLGGGPNGAARIYVVAVLLASYFFLMSNNWWRRTVMLGAIAILLQGLAATVSRTGILLFLLALAVATLAPARKYYGAWFMPILATIAGSLALLPSEYWHILAGIISSIVDGTDSVGFRYMQWSTAWEMFRDHTLAGVGVGQFKTQVHYYGTQFVPFYGIGFNAHNLVFALLSETGVVGFGLFASIILLCVAKLSRLWFDHEHISLASYFLSGMLFVSLLGGLTGDQQADKLIWCLFGIASGLRESDIHPLRQVSRPTEKTLATKLAAAFARIAQ